MYYRKAEQMSEIAINVQGISKVYKLYEKPIDRLKESLGLSRTKKYREHYALNDVSFCVEKGETIGIIGTNGSGKSTLLKIITGVLNPTKGDLTIKGRISALLELGAGFNMEYTGIENVYLNGTMMGFSREEIDAKLQDILDFADIGDFVKQPVKMYSSGMFVRLAFAVAINIEPEILIVDEALSVGDVFFQAKCFKKFEEFKEQGKTILLVSHDMGSIQKYCDRVILLNRGKVLAVDESRKVVDLYKKVLVNQFDVEEKTTAEQDVPAAEQAAVQAADWKANFVTNPKLIEYGEKQAEIIDYAIVDEQGRFSNIIESDMEFTLKFKVVFHEKVKEPIFAFTIKNVQGTEVTGTNTMYEGTTMRTPEAGETVVVSFKQKVSLRNGDYLISLGCTGYRNGEFVVYHRLYDVLNLTAVAKKDTVGFFDMNSEVTVTFNEKE